MTVSITEDRRKNVGQKVRRFYEQCSFPDYERGDDPSQLIQKARQGIYARLLDDHLPFGVRILDAGCGTGQLAIFLSINGRDLVGMDLSHASLSKGQAFKTRFHLKRVTFVQMDLFESGLVEESFDYVFCNGVLHHTADAARGFSRLCRLVKRGGYLIIGLYNTYARIPFAARRVLIRVSRGRLKRLDYILRSRSAVDAKSRAWYLDQYGHPHESTFSVDDVLRWFDANGIEYINSVPPIRFADKKADTLLRPRDPGTHLQRVVQQLGWMVTSGREGGFFVTIGQRRV